MARVRLATGGDTQIYPASHRYARISARKARLVMDLIRGDRVEAALTKLRFSPRRGAPMIRKVVESAVANAMQKTGTEAGDLVVYRAFVDEGPTMKRWRPRSMGRAYPRLKRTCHLTVVLKAEPAAQKKRAAVKPSAAAAQSSGEGQKD
ncbi:MAG: 50S ribosomal protein L22 [Planctomycetes bacterium]|nr:50S ribosomal protein L22 [Planctomycetota bacterium]